MTRGLQRATFNRSALVRVLSEISPDIPDPKYDFGERLGQWLEFSDALSLSSVLNTEAGPDPSIHPAVGELPAQLARVRRKLSDSIYHDGIFNTGQTGVPARIPFPAPLPKVSAESAADFSPYHRYYLAHQRDMNAAISTLRASARKALAGQSAAGRKLAELDAAFDKFLATRERTLLANIPIMLSRHFKQRHAVHRAALGDGCIDDPATWTQAGSWLEAFCHDTQTVLFAELELRLRPVCGLISSLSTAAGGAGEHNETTPQ